MPGTSRREIRGVEDRAVGVLVRVGFGLAVADLGGRAIIVAVRVNVLVGVSVAVAARTCASFADVESVGAKTDAQNTIKKRMVRAKRTPPVGLWKPGRASDTSVGKYVVRVNRKRGSNQEQRVAHQAKTPVAFASRQQSSPVMLRGV